MRVCTFNSELAALRYADAMRLAGWNNAHTFGPFTPGVTLPAVVPPPKFDTTLWRFEDEK